MSNKAESERLLTIEQAAALVNYDEATVLRWLAQGLKHCAGAPGRKRPRRKDVRIKASDLWSWVESISIVRTEAMPKTPARPKVAAGTGGAGGLSAWRKKAN